jgi:hypothetical protein
LDADGELYANRRLRVGVDGGMAADVVGREGDAALLGDGGVTSVCKIEVKIAFACSWENALVTRG